MTRLKIQSASQTASDNDDAAMTPESSMRFLQGADSFGSSNLISQAIRLIALNPAHSASAASPKPIKQIVVGLRMCFSFIVSVVAPRCIQMYIISCSVDINSYPRTEIIKRPRQPGLAVSKFQRVVSRSA